MSHLYSINFIHYSQKDSQEGIKTYFVAKSDEEVYEWLRNHRTINTPYKDQENDEDVYAIYDEETGNRVGTETSREHHIRTKGEMYDEDSTIDDLYYGKTLYGWELVKENIEQENIDTMINCGIKIEFVKERKNEN